MQDIQYEIVATENPLGIQHCKIFSAVVHGRERDSMLHWHNALEITLIEEGGIQYLAEGRIREVGPGDFVFINSGIIHMTRNVSDTEDIKALIMLIPDTFLEDLVPEISDPYFVIPEHSEVRDIIATYLEQIAIYIRQPRPFQELLIRKELISIVYQLFSKCYVKRETTAQDYLCKQIVEYTKKHFSGKLSIREVSSRFHLQENYFCRYFKKGTGLSYHQFLSQIRLQFALAQLAVGEHSETECALEAGFSSVKIFIDWCKKIYHCTPQQYVKQMERRLL